VPLNPAIISLAELILLIAAPKKFIKMQLSEESKVSSLAGG
jgi:hypothetical protein